MKCLAQIVVLAFLYPSMLLAQGKFSEEVFGDYFYNVARDTVFRRMNLPAAAVGGPKSNQGWVFRRIDFTYEYDINEQFSTRIRLEADGSGGPSGATTTDTKLAIFIKDAWLRWNNIFHGSNLILGIQPTSAYEVTESYWGFRSVEKPIADLRGLVPSRAFGFGLRGRLDGSGIFSYAILAANRGAGANPKDLSAVADAGQNDKYNVYALEIQWKVSKELQFSAYGDVRPAAPVNDPTSTTVPRATENHNTLTVDVFVGYQIPDQYSVGAEGVFQSVANSYSDPASSGATKPPKGQTSLGFSVFGSYYFDPTFGVLARFDRFDPKVGGDPVEMGDSRNYIIFGLIFKPSKNVSLIPNVQIESYESIPNSAIAYSNSVNGRLTFSFKF